MAIFKRSTGPAPAAYAGTIPTIAKAYENDPRNKLAQAAIALGTSVKPVAEGKWAIADGLARIGQALTGGYMQGQQNRDYAKREQAYTDLTKITPEMLAQLSGQEAQPTDGQIQPTALPNFNSRSPNVDPAQVAAAAALSKPTQDPYSQYPVGAPIPGAADQPWGKRADGTTKGNGFLGIRQRPDGNVSSELSIGVELGGKETQIPLMVPGLTPAEMNYLMNTPEDKIVSTLPSGLRDKAVAFAKSRMSNGQSPFRQPDESTPYDKAAGGGPNLSAMISQMPPVAPPAGQGAPNGPPPPSPTGPPQQAVPAPSMPVAPPQVAAGPNANGMGTPAPLLQAPTERPVAPTLPKRMQSPSLLYAQRLLASGNPDVAALGQAYMEKAMGEVADANKEASRQQFEQGQTEYGSNLRGFENASSDARQAQVYDRRDTIKNNFDDYILGKTQAFTATENARQRLSGENIARIHEKGENDRAAAKNSGQDRAAFYYNTVGGAKMRTASLNKVNENQNAININNRLLALNEKMDTGGITSFLPNAMRHPFNKDFAELQGLANDAMVKGLGGLGGHVSDSDVKIYQTTGAQNSNPRLTNHNLLVMKNNALERDSEFEAEKSDAIASGYSGRAFDRQWKQYVKENSIAKPELDAKGKPTNRVAAGIVPYQAWLSAKNNTMKIVE